MEWLAWIYGRFFANHTTLSYVLVVLLALVAVPVALVVWARAIEKYRTDHPPAALLPAAPLSSSLPPAQTVESAKVREAERTEQEKSKERKPEARSTQADRSIKIGEGAQITSSPMTTGDNSPLTINQIPASPPARTLSQEKIDRLVNELAGDAAVDINLLLVDDETRTFGNQIRMAFEKAGWRVSTSIGSTLGMTVVSDRGVTSFNGEGFTCSAKEDAPELEMVLKAFAAIDLKCAVRHDLPGRAPLSIYIGKRN